MVVFVRNLQARVSFNHAMLAMNSEILMKALGVANYDVSVVCVGKKLIKSLNSKYRRRNKVTDVLAFPNFEVGKLCFITFVNYCIIGSLRKHTVKRTSATKWCLRSNPTNPQQISKFSKKLHFDEFEKDRHVSVQLCTKTIEQNSTQSGGCTVM